MNQVSNRDEIHYRLGHKRTGWDIRDLVVRTHDLRPVSHGFESKKKSMVVTRRASDLL